MSRTVHPIEAESYRRLREAVDLSHLPPLSRLVTERVVHASADLDYPGDLVLDEAALRDGVEALAGGAEIVADVAMVAAGVTARPVRCGVSEPEAAEVAASAGLTRTAAGLRVAARAAGPEAVYVIGCAPTALETLLDAWRHGAADEPLARPALVVGLPVGFVGAVEAKQDLRDAGVPAVSNRGPKGGSGVAAAAVNALLYEAAEMAGDSEGLA